PTQNRTGTDDGLELEIEESGRHALAGYVDAGSAERLLEFVPRAAVAAGELGLYHLAGGAEEVVVGAVVAIPSGTQTPDTRAGERLQPTQVLARYVVPGGSQDVRPDKLALGAGRQYGRLVGLPGALRHRPAREGVLL